MLVIEVLININFLIVILIKRSGISIYYSLLYCMQLLHCSGCWHLDDNGSYRTSLSCNFCSPLSPVKLYHWINACVIFFSFWCLFNVWSRWISCCKRIEFCIAIFVLFITNPLKCLLCNNWEWRLLLEVLDLLFLKAGWCSYLDMEFCKHSFWFKRNKISSCKTT